MKAAIFYNPSNYEVKTVAEPAVGPGDVLIDVKACGVCGTDNLILNGAYAASFPLILGHEYSGIIREIGEEVKGFAVGDPVAVDPNILCGECFYCRRGEGNLCKEYIALGVTRNGGFAELSSAPSSNVYKLDDNVDIIEAALIEPLACCIRGLERGEVHHGDVVVVLGGGPIGNMILQLARLAGAGRIVVAEPLSARRELALSSGADQVLDPETDDILEAIRQVEPEGADLVFECSGSQSAQEISAYLVRRGGTIVLFGCSSEDQRLSISPSRIVENELTVKGSHNNPYTAPKAARLISSGKISVSHLISHRIPLDRIEEAFDLFGREGVDKIVITP